jgi:uncharacterized protein with HEPN domain
MYHSNLELIKHISDECSFILKFTNGLNYDEFYDNIVLRKAIERSIEIIGEACKKIDVEFKTNHTQIKWKEMAGTRDIIIHNYAGVDYEIVWQIIEVEIPELAFQIEDLLNKNT